MAAYRINLVKKIGIVSTHSHPKVAAKKCENGELRPEVSTHSHPKVAAKVNYFQPTNTGVSTHSHPKVAA